MLDVPLPIGLRVMMDGILTVILNGSDLPKEKAKTVAEIMVRRTYLMEIARFASDPSTAKRAEDLGEAATILGLEEWIEEQSKTPSPALPKLSARDAIAKMAKELHMPEKQAREVARKSAIRVEEKK